MSMKVEKVFELSSKAEHIEAHVGGLGILENFTNRNKIKSQMMLSMRTIGNR